jgi:hypothetical protein
MAASDVGVGGRRGGGPGPRHVPPADAGHAHIRRQRRGRLAGASRRDDHSRNMRQTYGNGMIDTCLIYKYSTEAFANVVKNICPLHY